MKFKTLTQIFFIFYISAVDLTSATTDLYYWKDYTGELPPDAFVAGKSAGGKSVYIGQVYRANKGILPVQINPGHEEVFSFTERIVEKTQRGIKILCGDSSIFEWLTTNDKNFTTDIIGKTLVVGGFQTFIYYPETVAD